MANAAPFGGFLLYLAEAFKQIRDGAMAVAFTIMSCDRHGKARWTTQRSGPTEDVNCIRWITGLVYVNPKHQD